METTYALKQIVPMSEDQYQAMNRERADEGFGPFCNSYAEYLKLCAAENAYRATQN
jgi:hypothetical protein